MAVLRHHKVTGLPGTLAPHSVYYVAPPAKPDYIEVYVTDATGSSAKRLFREEDVQALIDAALASFGSTEVVADITERDALTPLNGTTVLVLDASDDATVTSGAATYIYREATTTWVKISESESMDIALTWAALSGKPTSSPASIDAAVGNSHTHANLTQLGLIGQDGGGELTYNGQNVRARLDTGDW